MFCLSVKGFLNVVGPVRCMRETSGTLSRNHSVSSRGIERLGTVRPERVLPETRRLPLMVEEEVRAFEFFGWLHRILGSLRRIQWILLGIWAQYYAHLRIKFYWESEDHENDLD